MIIPMSYICTMNLQNIVLSFQEIAAWLVGCAYMNTVA